MVFAVEIQKVQNDNQIAYAKIVLLLNLSQL